MTEQTGAPGTQADPGTQPPAGAPPTQADGGTGQQSSEQQPETISLEEAKKLRSEARSLRERLKTLEETARTADEAKLSEQERTAKRLADLERDLADRDRAIAERTVLAATIETASRLGFANPRLAHRLLDMAAVDFDGDGQPVNVEKLLRDLLRDEPYLASAHARASGSIDGGTRGAPGLTLEQIKTMTPAETAARWPEIEAYLERKR